MTTPRKKSSADVKPARRPLALMKRPAQPVLFEFHDGAASRACIAGSFNDWRPDGLDMIAMGDGKWFKELLLSPGYYEYRLVVDGKWMPDPAAAHVVPNPFGEANSLLLVTSARAEGRPGGSREASPPAVAPA